MIMSRVEGLAPGENLTILIDHHPGHLYGILERLGHAYSAQELDGGLWWVTITGGCKTKEPVETGAGAITGDLIINQVINRFPETVEAFHRFNIDACCGGNRTIALAAKEDKADLAALIAGLNDIIAQKRSNSR